MTDFQFIQLPDGPPLTGLAFRRFADASDFAEMVTVIEACQEYDQVDPLSSEAGVPTVTELKDLFSHAENIDLTQDMLLVVLDGVVIGFQWVRWWIQADDTRIYYHRGRVIPRWRGHGIGTATLRWAEGRIRQLVRAHKSFGRAIFQANTTSREAAYNELLVTEGYTPVHSFIELGFNDSEDLPHLELPDGFVLKPATPQDYRAIWQANEAAFADEWGHRHITEEDYIKFLGNILANPGFDPALWQVAWYGDEVAGVALSEIRAQGVGEISELSVRQAWRGRGLARVLLVNAIRALQAREVRHIRIFTDADDAFGARSLYERVGFRLLTEYIRYQKPVDVI